MFSIPILKQDFRINRIRILVIFGIQMASMAIAIGIYGMKLIQISDIFWDTIPVIILPMILEMILACQVVLKRACDGTMDFILGTGIKPEKIVRTKALFVLLSGLFIMAVSTVLGCVTNVYSLTGEWDLPAYLWLNVGACCLQFMISGFCFYVSCRTKKTVVYVRAAVIVPIVMYVVYVIYYWMDNLFFLQYLTIFSLFRQSWFSGRSWLAFVGCGIFLVLGVIFFFMGNRAFYLYDINAYQENRTALPVNRKKRRR